MHPAVAAAINQSTEEREFNFNPYDHNESGKEDEILQYAHPDDPSHGSDQDHDHAHDHDHDHAHDHDHDHAHDHDQDHVHGDDQDREHDHFHDHEHDHELNHDHEDDHDHGHHHDGVDGDHHVEVHNAHGHDENNDHIDNVAKAKDHETVGENHGGHVDVNIPELSHRSDDVDNANQSGLLSDNRTDNSGHPGPSDLQHIVSLEDHHDHGDGAHDDDHDDHHSDHDHAGSSVRTPTVASPTVDPMRISVLTEVGQKPDESVLVNFEAVPTVSLDANVFFDDGDERAAPS
jgi:hypothetical protein